MTVSNIPPRIEYPNTSGVDTFAYAWDMISESTIQAVLDDVILTEGVVDNGGTVTITPAPVGNLILKRRTPVHQPENYAFTQAFKANKTELTLDRCFLIAQELESAGLLTPDLSSIRYINGIEVVSELGLNAGLVLWGGGLAGLFSGEITQTAPDDDTETDKPESYVWMQHQTASFEYVSSWTYPVYVQESYAADHTALGGQMVTWLPEEYVVTHSVVSGVLTVTVAYISHTQPPENYEVTHEVVSGALTTVVGYLSHTQPPENYEVTHEVVSGVLTTVVGYLTHTQPPETYAVTHAVVSGDLVTV